jgi:putative SOS response-associated peptidase YedK
MCGRARLSSDVSEIKLVFSIPPHRPTPNFPPSWNVAPTDSLPVVRHDTKAGERSLDLLRWGLVPFWAKDLNVGFANINAKAEGIENRPAFREAFQFCSAPAAKDLHEISMSCSTDAELLRVKCIKIPIHPCDGGWG